MLTNRHCRNSRAFHKHRRVIMLTTRLFYQFQCVPRAHASEAKQFPNKAARTFASHQGRKGHRARGWTKLMLTSRHSLNFGACHVHNRSERNRIIKQICGRLKTRKRHEGQRAQCRATFMLTKRPFRNSEQTNKQQSRERHRARSWTKFVYWQIYLHRTSSHSTWTVVR